MTTRLISKRMGVAAAALLTTIGLSQPAKAITLTWLDGPHMGQPYTPDGLGGTTWSLTNYDTGTLYQYFSPGTVYGFGQGGGSGSVAAGEAALNGPDNSAVVFRNVLNGFNSEDGWGILKIAQIEAIDTDNQSHAVFNSVTSPFELTGIFHGEKDFYLNQVFAPGFSSGQVIDGTGLQFDIYSDLAKNFAFSAGPNGRTSAAAYGTATDGTLELSLLSTPGFINHAGSFGGTATEFESFTSLVGHTAMNVVGGTPASVYQFNTDAVGFGGTTGQSFVPGDLNPTSDVWFQFTTSPGTAGWDVTSHDPGTFVVVPEPASAAGVIGCLAPLLGMAFRRSRVRTVKA